MLEASWKQTHRALPAKWYLSTCLRLSAVMPFLFWASLFSEKSKFPVYSYLYVCQYLRQHQSTQWTRKYSATQTAEMRFRANVHRRDAQFTMSTTANKMFSSILFLIRLIATLTWQCLLNFLSTVWKQTLFGNSIVCWIKSIRWRTEPCAERFAIRRILTDDIQSIKEHLLPNWRGTHTSRSATESRNDRNEILHVFEPWKPILSPE